ncbi:MAG: hypothetical protein PVJ67_05540 [Candidatus Pacearchaeota archaeon]|jgi:hypothetical protein
MRNSAGKFWEKTKKVISLASAFAVFATGSAFAYQNKTLEEELLRLKPAGSKLRLSDSEISTKFSADYNLPDGIDFGLTDLTITLDSGKDSPPYFEYEISKEDFDFNPKGIKVLKFTKDFGNFLSKKELKEQFTKVITRGMNLEDVVLFQGQPVTVGDMKEMFKEIDGFSETTREKNSLGYKIDLSGFANADNLTTTFQGFETRDGEKIKFIHGFKGIYNVNVGAYFNLGVGRPDSITLGDFANRNFPEHNKWISLLPEDISKINLKKLKIDAEAGTDYYSKLTVSEFAQVETPRFIFGAMQENSEENETHSRVFANLRANPENLSATIELGEENSEVEKESKRDLVYGILKPNENFSAMVGWKNKNTRIRTKLERGISRVGVERDGQRHEETNKRIKKIENSSKSEIIYGFARKSPLFFIPGIDTELSGFATTTNYPDDNSNVGATIKSRLVNGIINSNGNYKTFLTLFGNKGHNPFPEYFNEKINREINPLGNMFEDITRRELYREMNGVFLEGLKEGEEARVGGVFAPKGDSYIRGGGITGENTNGFYASAEIFGIGINALYKKIEDGINKRHGENASAGLYYNFNRVAAELNFQSKPDELTKPDKVYVGVRWMF